MNERRLTLRQLRAFVTIADAGGFAAAARTLHLTPSALSLLVKDLEQCLEVRLFDRTTRTTTLTGAGRSLYPFAHRVLDDIKLACDSMRELGQLERGVVRVACTPLYAATTLPGLIARYRQRHPAITIHALDSLGAQVLPRVASGEADIGIAPHRQVPSEFSQQLLLRDRIWLVCRPDHPLARKARVTWSQAASETFISLASDFTRRLQADLFKHSAKLKLEPVHEVSFVTTALGMVASGLGISAQAGHVVPLARAFGLVVRPLVAPTIHRDVSLFHLRGRSLTPAAHSFVAFLHEEVVSGALPRTALT